MGFVRPGIFPIAVFPPTATVSLQGIGVGNFGGVPPAGGFIPPALLSQSGHASQHVGWGMGLGRFTPRPPCTAFSAATGTPTAPTASPPLHHTRGVDPRSRDPESNLPWTLAMANMGMINVGLLADHEEDVDSYATRYEQILGDGTFDESERVLYLSGFLYVFTSRYTSAWAGQPAWRTRALALPTQTDASPGEQLAGALAIGFLGELDQHPEALKLVMERGLSHANAVIRVKAALSLLSNRSRATMNILRDRWSQLPPLVQDRTIDLVISRAHEPIAGEWKQLLESYLDGATDIGATNDPQTVQSARTWLALFQFRALLAREPELLASAKGANLEGKRAYNARREGTSWYIPPSPAEIDNPSILNRVIPTVAAAMHIMARFPERGDDEIGLLARRVVGSRLLAQASNGGRLMDEWQTTHSEQRSIFPADLVGAYTTLVSDEDPLVQYVAASGLVSWDATSADGRLGIAVLQTLFQRPDFTEAVGRDVLADFLLEGADSNRLAQAGFFNNDGVQERLAEIARRDDLPTSLSPRALAFGLRHLSPERTLALIDEFSPDQLRLRLLGRRATVEESHLHTSLASVTNRVIREMRFEHRGEAVAFLEDRLTRTSDHEIATQYAIGLAMQGVFEHPRQQFLFREVLERHLEVLHVDHHRAYLFGHERAAVGTMEPWRLAAVATVHHQQFLSDEDIRRLAGDLNGATAEDDRTRFAQNVLVSALVAERGSGGNVLSELIRLGPGFMNELVTTPRDPQMVRLVKDLRDQADALSQQVFGSQHSTAVYYSFDRALSAAREQQRMTQIASLMGNVP